MRYWICVITRCAETGRVPPASGVIVRAAAVPAGFRTVRTELMTVVSTIAILTIWEVPVIPEDTRCNGNTLCFHSMVLRDGIAYRYYHVVGRL